MSRFLEGRDIQSIQKRLLKVAASLPDTTTHYERHNMTMNSHQEKPGKGVMYWEEKEKRSHEKSPDFKGFLILEMDYKAGEKLKISAWQRDTSRGYPLLSLSEDNYSKKMKQTPQEDRQGYQKRDDERAYRPRNIRDEDVPF